MIDEINMIITALMVLIFGVACFMVGYITMYKKVMKMIPFVATGQAITQMIAAGTFLNLDFVMFWQNEAERSEVRGSEAQRNAQSFHSPRRTPSNPAILEEETR